MNIYFDILSKIFLAIENLRLERDHLSPAVGGKKQRRHSSIVQQKPVDSPVHTFASLEQHT